MDGGQSLGSVSVFSESGQRAGQSASSFRAVPQSIPFHLPSEESGLQAVSQAKCGSSTFFLTEFDRLFEMKGQFTEGSFDSISAAISIVKQKKMVTIKMLLGLLRKLLAPRLRSSKMLQATRGWPFVPKFISAFQVNLVRVVFVFEHEDVLDLREAWQL